MKTQEVNEHERKICRYENGQLPGGYEAHPAADVFPLMSDEQLQHLSEDIKKNGLEVPITLFEDKVLDGRNRLIGCEIAGAKPKFVQYEGDDPWGFVKSCNEHRRHMKKSQRTMAMKRWVEGNAKWREDRSQVQEAANKSRSESVLLQQRNDDGQFGPLDGSPVDPPATRPSHEAEHHTRKQLASIAGVGSSLAQKAITIDGIAPDLGDRVLQGEISLDKAYKEAKKIKNVANVTSDGCGDLVGKVEALVVVFDSDTSEGEKTGSVSKLERKQIEKLADPRGSVLFLFISAGILIAALSFLKSRGFEFRKVIPWYKEKKAQVGANNGAVELCLIGTQGDPLVNLDRLPSLIAGPPQKNEVLPKFIYELIEQLIAGVKVEFGGNRRPRNGWNQLDQHTVSTGRSDQKPAKKKATALKPAKKRVYTTANNRQSSGEPTDEKSPTDTGLVEGIAIATGSSVREVSKQLDSHYDDFVSFLRKLESNAQQPISEALRHPGVVASAFLSYREASEDAEGFWPRAVAGTSASDDTPVMELHRFLWELGEKESDGNQAKAMTTEQVKIRCLHKWSCFHGGGETRAEPGQVTNSCANDKASVESKSPSKADENEGTDHSEEFDLNNLPKPNRSALISALAYLDGSADGELGVDGQRQLLDRHAEFVKFYHDIVEEALKPENKKLVQRGPVVVALAKTFNMGDVDKAYDFWRSLTGPKRNAKDLHDIYQFLHGKKRAPRITSSPTDEPRKGVLSWTQVVDQCLHGWRCRFSGESWNPSFYKRNETSNGRSENAEEIVKEGTVESTEEFVTTVPIEAEADVRRTLAEEDE